MSSLSYLKLSKRDRERGFNREELFPSFSERQKRDQRMLRTNGAHEYLSFSLARSLFLGKQTSPKSLTRLSPPLFSPNEPSLGPLASYAAAREMIKKGICWRKKWDTSFGGLICLTNRPTALVRNPLCCFSQSSICVLLQICLGKNLETLSSCFFGQ